jgi:hypothetical protein
LKSILDPAFRYIPSIETDVRKTFDRIRREQREQSGTTANRGAGTNVQQLRAVTSGMSRASGGWRAEAPCSRLNASGRTHFGLNARSLTTFRQIGISFLIVATAARVPPAGDIPSF